MTRRLCFTEAEIIAAIQQAIAATDDDSPEARAQYQAGYEAGRRAADEFLANDPSQDEIRRWLSQCEKRAQDSRERAVDAFFDFAVAAHHVAAYHAHPTAREWAKEALGIAGAAIDEHYAPTGKRGRPRRHH